MRSKHKGCGLDSKSLQIKTLDLRIALLSQSLMWVGRGLFCLVTQGSRFPPVHCIPMKTCGLQNLCYQERKNQSIASTQALYKIARLGNGICHFCLYSIGKNSVKWSQSIFKRGWEYCLSVCLGR